MLIDYMKPQEIAKIASRLGPDLVSDDMVLDTVTLDIQNERDVTRIWNAWCASPHGEKPRNPNWTGLYRAWAARLRKIGTADAIHLIRILYLEQTMPDNELETPYFIDAYTGIEDPKPKNGQRETWPAGYFTDKWTPFVPAPDPLLRQISRAYEYPGEALRASVDWVGSEEEHLVFADQEWQPEHITMANEGNVDREVLDALLEEIKPETDALDKKLSGCQETGPKRRRQVMEWNETKSFLTKLERFAMRGEDLLCVAKIFLRYQSGWCFGAEGNEISDVRNEPDRKAVLAADLIRVPGPDRTLRGFIALWLDELLDGVEAMGPVEHDEMSDDEIRSAADLMLRQYLSILPVSGRPQNTRQFIAGFIEGVVSGSDNGMESGWENYRRTTSPAGAAAYTAARGQGASRRRAMQIFYQAAMQNHDLQSAPKKVRAIRKDGLMLSNGRYVNWNTAVKIARLEGFDRAGDLAIALRSYGWGYLLVKTLESNVIA
ncbi:MAG: hypothetical protein A2Y38_23880 [Spirochaetes bacterium GWB1_59_5]|nr:MAG: hypothetical protein A2Y38_23880 [Spirochaetes bacterium GWB1_59_5]